MIKSLFDSAESQKTIDRINSLSSTSGAQWGKMNVTQMLIHCQQPLKVCLGELKLKKGLMGMLFGGMIKKMILKDEPYNPNLPTAREFIITGSGDFENEKKALIEFVKRFSQNGAHGLPKEPHPVFGKLTDAEWDFMQWKHLDHHLRQFGV